MTRPRKLVTMCLCLSLVASAVACSGADDPSTTADPKAAPESIVGASEESKTELGVTEWHVTQGDTDKSFLIVGVDEQGARRAEVTMRAESRPQNGGLLTYEVAAPEAFTLRYEIGPDGASATSNVEELAAKAPRARLVILQIGKDFQHADVKPGQSLTQQSIRPLMGYGSPAGSSLVQPGQRVVQPGRCLMDNSGNGCVGSLIQTSAAIVGTGFCLLASGFTLGLATAACAAGGVAAVGSAVSMYEQGCKLRPCSSGPTS